MLGLLFLLGFFVSPTVSSSCRFAPDFTQRDLLTSPSAQDRFLSLVAQWEGQFHSDGVGLNEAIAYTYDGHGIDFQTGGLADPLHAFSAPSKESPHLMMLARALEGNKHAQIFISPSNPTNATARAIQLLQRKMDTYLSWNKKYPGYGGFMPWVKVANTGLDPTDDWFGKVPALDNGEMIWGLYAVYKVANKTIGIDETQAQQLRSIYSSYKAYFDMLARNSVMMFYNGDGHVRAECKILDIYAQPYPGNYQNNGPNYFLDDPYEGELFVFFMDLYGTWQNPADKDLVWKLKRAKLVPRQYQTPKGLITVQQGFWFSSHETWKVMELPYNTVPIHKRVFTNGERARTCNSNQNKISGLFGCASNFTANGGPIQQYVSAVGIASIASQPILDHVLITPYGTFPIALVNLSVSLVWYHNMLVGSKMQGPYGSTEACDVNGQYIAPVLTWDTKITTLCAFVGGVTDIVEQGLRQDGTYQRFYDVVDREWGRVFTKLNGENIDLCLPSVAVPNILPDFSMCTRK